MVWLKRGNEIPFILKTVQNRNGLRTLSHSRIPSVTPKGVGLAALAVGVSKNVNHQLLSFINFMNHENYETVVNDWLTDNLISEKATSLRYEDDKTSEHFGSFIGTVDVMNGNSVIRSIRNYRDLWQIDVAFGSTLYREPLTTLNEGTFQTVQDFYNRFKGNYDHTILKDVGATIVNRR